MIMIGVSTRSYFQLIPSIFTRSFSTVECSLVQLYSDIDFLHQELTYHTLFSMSRYRVAVMKQKIASGFYFHHPIRVKHIQKVDLLDVLRDTQPDSIDIMLGTGSDSDPNMIYVVMPDEEEVLVLVALSIMLVRLSHDSLPEDGYRLDHLDDTFYESLKRMGKLDKLVKLDLKASYSMMPISLILDKVKPYLRDGAVYRLISSFLSLPIIDDDGNHRSDICWSGMPHVGEITKVLFNIVLKETFDREFPRRFPGISFTRFKNEVFISTRSNDEVIFEEKAGYALLEELGLGGNIVSIGPGDDPLLCARRLVFVDSDGKVQVCDTQEYY